MNELVRTTLETTHAEIVLNDPEKRNALGAAMFDALEAQLEAAAANESIHVVLLRGEGAAFCAGFDLPAAIDRPELMEQFIERLSLTVRAIRRLPHVVVAAVQGAAIAGGCALVSACDLVMASPNAKFGYPVHQMGISPAVTIPTLQQVMGPGAARSLLMSGRLMDGVEAHRLHLASHLSSAPDALLDEARSLCRILSGHGRMAMRVTKSWLNELDGSLEDDRFDGPVRDSAPRARQDEAVQMLRAFWASRG